MVCIDCHLHGKRIHLLSKPINDEHVFITSKSQVFPETCASCRDSECPYNFNMPQLLKYKWLRKKVLEYVFDASFDDMLLEYGIMPMRTVPILRETESDIYSKPTYTKRDGDKLLKLDKKILKLREKHFKAIDDINDALKEMKNCPLRVIIKRKF